MQKKLYDPLLDKYFSYDEVKNFESKKEIKDLFEEERSLQESTKAKASPHIPKAMTVDLANNYNYEKVLVGSYGDVPFYALIDRAKGVSIPLFKDENE